MTTAKQPFNPNDHITKLPRKTKDKETGEYITVYDDYLEVKWRLIWFREAFPSGTIDTEEILVDLDREFEQEGAIRWVPDPARQGKNKKETYTKRVKGYARYHAVVTDGVGGRATGTKTETALDFPDFCEKAETGAIGRALAALGFGTQFAPEFNEGERIVDSPVVSSPETGKNDEKKPTEPRPSSSSIPPAPASAPAKSKVVPSVPAEAPKLATSGQLEQISEVNKGVGIYEWKHLLSQLRLSEDTAKWTQEKAQAFLDSVKGWAGSQMQKEWGSKPAEKAQRDEVMTFTKSYGVPAVLALRDRIPETKGVDSKNFTNSMVELLLYYLYAAEATVTQTTQIDPSFSLAKSLGASHPLDFYAHNPEDTTLQGYLTQLSKLEEAQKNKAA